MIRLQKYIAECGVASRRKAEELISQGKVKVNGLVIDKLGTKIDPQKDKIEVDGKTLEKKQEKIYIKFYKPRGVISSCRKYKEETILDYIKDIPYRLFPIGRLDKESEGLMLLTNDGELANRLMHPRYEHEKEYVVNVKCPMSNDKLEKIRKGIVDGGEKLWALKAKIINAKELSLVLKEGKKRQIRRMVEAVGNQVVKLVRVRIGNIKLGSLKPGEYAFLRRDEIL